ncbi:hypothetical protein [Candidatus Darwinibacter acetoxidans]|jgi:hypothetical protein
MREDIALFASWAVAIVFLLAAFWALGKYEKERDRRRELQSRMHMITKRLFTIPVDMEYTHGYNDAIDYAREVVQEAFYGEVLDGEA